MFRRNLCARKLRNFPVKLQYTSQAKILLRV